MGWLYAGSAWLTGMHATSGAALPARAASPVAAAPARVWANWSPELASERPPAVHVRRESLASLWHLATPGSLLSCGTPLHGSPNTPQSVLQLHLQRSSAATPCQTPAVSLATSPRDPGLPERLFPATPTLSCCLPIPALDTHSLSSALPLHGEAPHAGQTCPWWTGQPAVRPTGASA